MPLQLLKAGPWAPGTPRKLIVREAEEVREQAAQNDEAYQYAILSHRWGELKDEILFADLIRVCDAELRQNEGYISVDLEKEPGRSLKRKAGWFKIQAALEQARNDGYSWLWADTCCIDKSSSAELSEAINTMYAWYQQSAICYAFISDISSRDPPELRRQKFHDSKWFKRGWTLQELIAPANVVFFSAEWMPLGNKRSLAGPISAITKIDVETLNGTRPIETASVAKRMSWAAGRKTKRIEDRAYSLLGIFGVNMPMLYGEGSKAFQRLQQEIMKISDDQSIFCWVDAEIGDARHGLLADSPDAFAMASDYRKYDAFEEQQPFDMSNRGLSISLHLTPSEKPMYVAALMCPHPDSMDGYLAIYVEKLETGSKQFARVKCGQLGVLSVPGRLEQMFVRESFPKLDVGSTVMPLHLFHLSGMKSTQEIRYSIANTVCVPFDGNELDAHNLNLPGARGAGFTTFKIVKEQGRIAVGLLFRRHIDDERIAVLLGASQTNKFDVGFDIVECSGDEDMSALGEYEKRFDPRPFGQTLSVRYHHVTVRADTRILSGVKVYMVDIFLTGEARAADEHPMVEAVDVLLRNKGGGKNQPNRMSRFKTILTS